MLALQFACHRTDDGLWRLKLLDLLTGWARLGRPLLELGGSERYDLRGEQEGRGWVDICAACEFVGCHIEDANYHLVILVQFQTRSALEQGNVDVSEGL